MLKKIIKSRIITDLVRYPYGVLLNEKEKIIRNAMIFASFSSLKGDYLEFGVWKGKSFISAYKFAKLFNLKNMNFYAFDSFKGLPVIYGSEREKFKEGMFHCSVKTFKENLSRNNIDINKVKIIEGWYNDTLNKTTKKKLGIKEAAIIMIDCDLYASTVPVLDFITDYLVAGTIIIFDEWFAFKGDPNKGEQRAVNEWLKKNPNIKLIEYKKYGCAGISFIVTKTAKS